jgi:valyl-tRNA synthetase
LHDKKIPWKDIVVSGNISLGGEKMSKSKGNVVKPQDVMEKYGSDALRFWAAGSKLGGDLDYQEKDLVTGKKFVKKLENASRFVFMNLKKYDGKKVSLLDTDKLFLSQVNDLVEKCTKSFEVYEYSKAKAEVENFFWNNFCGNYLELVKSRVYNGSKKEKESAFYTLYNSLFAILKLIAPIMPFVTEEIYLEYYKRNEKKKSIHICSWPEKFGVREDEKAFDKIMKFNSEVWKKKKIAGKNLRDEIKIRVPKSLEKYKKDLVAMHNIK